MEKFQRGRGGENYFGLGEKISTELRCCCHPLSLLLHHMPAGIFSFSPHELSCRRGEQLALSRLRIQSQTHITHVTGIRSPIHRIGRRAVIPAGLQQEE